MGYFLKIGKLIFTQNGENLFSFSFQDYHVYKDCRKFSKNCFKKLIRFPCCVKINGSKIKICNGIFKENLVSFYFCSNNNKFRLYEPYYNVKICINNTGKNKSNTDKKYNFLVLETQLIEGAINYHQSNFFVGSDKQRVNLILDSGSSFIGIPTPFVKTNNFPIYNPEKSSTSKTTDLLLYESYGKGDMGCSIVNDKISLIEKNNNKEIEGLFGAGVYYTNDESPLFYGGIVGLAFPFNGYTDYVYYFYLPTKEMIENTDNFWQNLNPDIKSETFMDYIERYYGRYFAKFVLDIKRSLPDSYNKKNNVGEWILGGGEQFVERYKGKLIDINLRPFDNQIFFYQIYTSKITFKKEDKIFEINITEYNKNNYSIIDTGTTTLVFALENEQIEEFYKYMLSLPIFTPDGDIFFEKYDVRNMNLKILCPTSDIIFEQFPEIIYTINDGKNEYNFFVEPEQYLQNNFEIEGINSVASILEFNSIFDEKIFILGQPFIVNNYIVFDYSNKMVKIAPKKII
jgi:hypothetical protein